MNIDAAIKKIVIGKPFGLTMVKGAQRSGKTITAAYRALYLKSSYCLYEDEKVLVVASKKEDLTLLKDLYESAKNQFEYDYRTLFSLLSEEKVDFFTIEDLVDKFYLEYINHCKVKPFLIKEEEQKSILRECVEEIKSQYKRVKFIKEGNVAFIADEINWIKACDFNNKGYMMADRFGRNRKKGFPARLNKNSSSREAICNIMDLYQTKMKDRNLIDSLDKEKLALQAILKSSAKGYTHMVVDDAHRLSKLHINILMALNTKRAYSSMMLMVDHKAAPIDGAWIVKGRRQKDLGFEVNMRCSYLRKELGPLISKNLKVEEKKEEQKFSLEKYRFVDIRRRQVFEFQVDTANYNEFILLQDDKELACQKDELKAIPVYSNIAAGDPIAINPEVEGIFNIPHYWIRGMKDCFILKEKGDSMIGAAIEDGDFVVIRKQGAANNKDIIAVDLEGRATLKRLSIDKNDIILIPENDKYSPISLKNREALVLGVVIGVIKYAA